MSLQIYRERPGSQAQEGFGSWLAFGEQTDYNTPLTGWDELWQKKYEFISSGLRYESTPIVPQRVRASRSPIPNIRGRAMLAGSLSLQSHVKDMLPFWKEIFMMTKAQVKETHTDTLGYGTEEVTFDQLLTAKAVPAPNNNHLSIVDTAHADFKQPDDTTIKDGNCPAKLKITLGGTPAIRASQSYVKVAVFGTDQNDEPISEVLKFDGRDNSNDDDANWAAVTKNYYKKVGVHPDYTGAPAYTGDFAGFRRLESGETAFKSAGIQIIDLAAGSPTIAVATDNGTVLTHFSRQDPILHGNTFYVQKGKIPNSYFGGLFNQCTFQFGETCQIDVDILGRNGMPRVPINHQELYGAEQGRAVIPGPPDKGGTGNDAWDFAPIEDEVNPGWEGGILLKEHGDSEFFVIPCTDISAVFNNNLSHPERYWFNRYHIKPTASEVLEAMVNASVDYKTAQGLDYQFLANISMEAKIIAYAKPAAGRQYRVEINCPNVQLNSTVDPEVSDNGPITQSFDLKCVPTDANAGDEMTVIVESDQKIADLE